MKRVVILFAILFLFLQLVFSADPVLPKNGTYAFVTQNTLWCYEEEKSLDTLPKGAKGTFLYFGNKVLVLSNKKVKETYFLQVQLPDKSKYWSWAAYFTPKFITITQKDVKTYSQPDTGYQNKLKLQPGFLGYYVKEMDGWINVEFKLFAPKKADDKPVWVGSVWLNASDTSFYTEDWDTAYDANSLLDAYNLLYGKKIDIQGSVNVLKQSLAENDGRENIAVNLIRELLIQIDPSYLK